MGHPVSGPSLLGGLVGLLVAVGTGLILTGLVPAIPRPAGEPRAGRRWRRHRAGARTRWRWTAAGVGGLGVWWLTGWPVLGLVAAATTVGLPALLATSRVTARGLARVQAVEDWTRRLADILVVGVGLEQAVITSERSVPEPIRGEVAALVARLGARWPTEVALRAFADDLDDPTGDLVVAGLILGHRRRGPGLARALTTVADSVAEEVAVRRRVEADRAKPRATARAVTGITLGVIAVGALNRTYLAPYGTPLGQLVLAGIAAAFLAALAWLRALTRSPRQPRLLAAAGSAAGLEP